MFKKYPFIKQEGIKDCGSTCLAMITEFYNGYISLDELKDLTKTTKTGTNAYNLLEAAQYLGFETKGLKTNLNQMEKMILPCIAHVTLNKSYKHYIVIYEINFIKKYLIVADPASKIKKITFTDFNQIFNNVILTLWPKKPILISNKTSLFSFICNIVGKNKTLLKQILFLSLFVTLFSILSSFFLETMIDNSYLSKNILIFWFLIFLLINIVKIITDYFRNKILINLNQKLDIELTLDTFKQIIQLPYHYYRNRTTGEILSRFTDLSSVRMMISKVALTLFVDLPLTITSFIILYFLNTSLCLLTFLIFLFYLLLIILFKPLFNKYINNLQEQKANVTSYMVESIQGFETVKGISLEKKVISNFENKYVKLLKTLYKFDNLTNTSYLLKELIQNLGFLFLILLGSMLVLDNKISIGNLITYQILFNYFLEPIRSIIDLDSNIKEAKNALKRTLELFSKQTKDGILKEMNNNIKISNLNYGYNREDILKNISLEIKSGDKVMITGSSGSGKSTLLKIIMKYYEVERNKVLLGKYDLNDYKEEAIKQNISFITQQETLFTGTILDNLNLEQTEETKILEMVNLCCIDEIINKDNLGLYKLIEENGFNFSGGERQRLVLARSLLKNFNICMIDEGTNQMDVSLERKILKNIFNKFSTKTFIVISHRLENIDLYNHVIEIKDGTIIRDVLKNV